MSEEPIFIKMKKNEKHRERLQDKTDLFRKVSIAAAAGCLALALLGWFLLDIREVIPFVLGGYALTAALNLRLFRFHRNLTAAYLVASLTALLAALR